MQEYAGPVSFATILTPQSWALTRLSLHILHLLLLPLRAHSFSWLQPFSVLRLPPHLPDLQPMSLSATWCCPLTRMLRNAALFPTLTSVSDVTVLLVLGLASLESQPPSGMWDQSLSDMPPPPPSLPTPIPFFMSHLAKSSFDLTLSSLCYFSVPAFLHPLNSSV